MNIEHKTDARLLCAASFVRESSVIADIGTDHAYLPIYLIKEGIASCAVAADINEGPLERARVNVAEAGLSGKISLCLTDGLTGIEKFEPTDILICGMGGELIEKIVSGAPFTKNKNIRLILQPMSKQEILRAYLLGAGYNIIDEKLSYDDGRVYVCIRAEYDGVVREYTETELLLGRRNIEKKEELFFPFLFGKIKALEKRKTGMKTAGLDTPAEDELLAKLYKFAERN